MSYLWRRSRILQNESIGECLYCGSKVAIPVSVAKKAELYNTANQRRQEGRFDEARSIYEHLLIEEEEADAYWGITLCKYGIEYVKDPKTSQMIPTCHRAAYTSFVDDEDFKNAIKYADVQKRKLWVEEAQKIDEILKGILIEVQKQNKYDIFICYKEKDDNGKRTEDSVYAREIYDQLTKEGYKVFYAPKSIKFGEAYEPCIFAALQSAKLMFLISTRVEYFEAPWVRNEWSRYQLLFQAGHDKKIIVLYKDINPKIDLPVELVRAETYDMNQRGYIHDISDAAKKIVGVRTKTDSKMNANKRVALRYVERAEEFLKNSDVDSALNNYNKAISIDETCSEAWWGKLKILTNNFQISDKWPVFSIEEKECRNLALKYCSNKQRIIYEPILSDYEKDICELISSKKQKELDQIYDEERKNLHNAEFLNRINEKTLDLSMKNYNAAFKEIEEKSYIDKKQKVKERCKALNKYREVFNTLLIRYSPDMRMNDTEVQKQVRLKEKIANKKEEIDKYKGSKFSIGAYLITCILIIISFWIYMTAMWNKMYSVSLILAMLCFNAGIIVYFTKNYSLVARIGMYILLLPILLIILYMIAGIPMLLTGQNNESMVRFIYVYIIFLLLSLCCLIFMGFKYKKKTVYQNELNHLRQCFNQGESDIKKSIDSLLDDCEKQCFDAKKYFLDRKSIYYFIQNL